MNFKVTICLSFLFFFACSSNILLGQKKEADGYFNDGQYSKALKFYNLYEKIDKRENSLLNRAICYYHLNKPVKCLSDLSKVEQMGNKSQNFLKYSALALHVSGQYEEAAKFYKRYLNKLKKGEEYNQTLTAIKQCGFARNYKYTEPQGYADNLGRILNTKNDEERVIESLNYPNRI